MQRHERSFGGVPLSPTPSTRMDKGSSRVKHALLAKNAHSTELPTNFRVPYSSTPSPTLPPSRELRAGDRNASANRGGPCPRFRRGPPREKNRQQLDFPQQRKQHEGKEGRELFGRVRSKQRQQRRIDGVDAHAPSTRLAVLGPFFSIAFRRGRSSFI